MIKKILRLFIFFFCLFFMITPSYAEETAGDILGAEVVMCEDYTIVVDGREVGADVPPVERDGMIFIPLRFAAVALKAEVDWLAQEKTAVLRRGDSRVVLHIGDTRAETAEGEKYLVSAPFIFEQRTMIPLRAAAEGLHFRVEEATETMFLTSPPDAPLKPFTKAGAAEEELGKETVDYGKVYAIFRAQARRDRATQVLRPYVIAAWAVALLIWLVKLILALIRREGEHRDKILIGLILCGGVPFVLAVMLSTYWAAIVAIGTSIAGLFSTEDYSEKLVTMASSAQGLGLICTLFGLGLVIGPAIATHNIAAIGYGIYVKIEPTITGLALSFLLNVLYGYEARKAKMEPQINTD
ncbi:MAG: copper amine oxidase N-terminal domain-containing protein [bacterium]